ncbi:MAG: ABC transporter ATP-binding protein [Deltaproteobacteria bacterium]|nr:ABC transporter ATP-binding protein [Deltaproteobacteria bacterium]
MIKLTDLTKNYKGVKAVDNLNLEVGKGKVFGFLGPNGAGKTTTIKMMAGVLKPTGGRIIINGMDIAKEPSEVKRSIGFIPDRPFLYEKLTGLEFLNFIAGLYGMDRCSSNNNHIMDLLEMFELDHWCDEMIESYSHGMKQRLVMCGALLHRPRVLIVDEPMVGLDPKGARLVKDVFREQSMNGTTVFMSTHSLEVAEELCQEIAIIQAGKILAKGSPKELQREAGIDGDLEKIFLKLTEGKRIAHERPLSTS